MDVNREEEAHHIVQLSPLHAALFSPDCNVNNLKTLLATDRDYVNDRSLSGRTPLHEAAWYHTDNLDIIQVLLQHGANVHLTDNSWETALHLVVRRCDDKLDALKELLSWGSSVNAMNCEGDTPLHIAIKINSLNVSKELIRSAHDVNVSDMNGDTALQLAIRIGNIQIMKELLGKKADVNRSNHNRNSPLHTAVLCRDLRAVRELLRHGCDVNFRNRQHDTPLHLVFEDAAPSIGILRELLNHGALIHCPNSKGITPWSYTLVDPHNSYLSKIMIKYSMLMDPTRAQDELTTFLYSHHLPSVDYDSIFDFLKRCLVEITRMKIWILDDLSLYEFITQGRFIDMVFEDEHLHISKWMLSVLLTDPFLPVYCDVIVEHISTPLLCDNLMRLSIYASAENKSDKIILDCHCVEMLLTFLSNCDIFNLIMAYSPCMKDNKVSSS